MLSLMAQANKILRGGGKKRRAAGVPQPLAGGEGGVALEALTRFGLALHGAGLSTARVEAALERVAIARGLELEVLCTPTSILLGLGPVGGQEVRLRRVEPGELDLGAAVEIDGLLRRFEDPTAAWESALAELEVILARPPRWGRTATVLAQVLGSASAALLFGGGAREFLGTAGVGLAIALLAVLLGRSRNGGRLFEPAASLLAAATATGAVRLGAPIDAGIVTLASLIVLIPGYSLTVAISELATRHLVSGTARLAGVVGTLLGMGLGVGLGQALVAHLPVSAALAWWTLDPAWVREFALLVVLIVPPCFVVLFKARARDALAITAAAMLAFFAARYSSELLGPELAAFGGALVLGLGSNLDARLRNVPASVVQAPGLMLLVPGSIGFRSVEAFLGHDALSGIEVAFSAALSASAIVGGLLAANVALPPRRDL